MSHNNNNHDHAHEEDFVMAFQDTADQPTLLLIHGFPLSSNLWVPQLDDLDSYMRVIAPDLRGHGNSDNVPGPYSVQQLADDCADLLGHLNVPTPFVVCGLSMGGYVALEFYRRYPEHVAGLILTATRAGADSEEGKVNRDRMIETAEKHGVTAVNKAMLPNLFAPDNYEEDEELVTYVREMMDKTSVEGNGWCVGSHARSSRFDANIRRDRRARIDHSWGTRQTYSPVRSRSDGGSNSRCGIGCFGAFRPSSLI